MRKSLLHNGEAIAIGLCVLIPTLEILKRNVNSANKKKFFLLKFISALIKITLPTTDHLNKKDTVYY